MKKITSAAVVGGLALVFVGAVTTPASAHTPTLVTNCGQVALQLTGYPAGSTTTAVVDGKPAWSATFGSEGFQDSVNFDPTVKHTWSIDVVSGDGDQQFDLHHVGESEAHCYAPPVEPPVEEEEPPVVVPPAPVTVVHVQDYVAKCDVTSRLAEFVFDNTGSTVDVPFTISDGTPAQVVTVKAGETARPQPYSIPASGATYTITAADKSWTFVAEADCPVVVTPPVEPPVVVPPVTEPPVVVPPVVEPPVVEPPVVETPTPELPVVETPITTLPVVDEPGALTPITTIERVEATPTAAKADGSLAFTGPLETGASLAAGLALLVAGIATAVVARARRRA